MDPRNVFLELQMYPPEGLLSISAQWSRLQSGNICMPVLFNLNLFACNCQNVILIFWSHFDDKRYAQNTMDIKWTWSSISTFCFAYFTAFCIVEHLLFIHIHSSTAIVVCVCIFIAIFIYILASCIPLQTHIYGYELERVDFFTNHS